MSTVVSISDQRAKRKRDEQVLQTSLDSLRAAKLEYRFEAVESDNSCALKRRKVCARSAPEAEQAHDLHDGGIPVVCETRAYVSLILFESSAL